jgi:hypothetical protein
MLREIFAEEWRRLPARIGGVKGVLSMAFLFFLAALPPLRFNSGFLDPLILLAYSSFAMIFAGPYAAQSFAGASERPLLDNPGVPARDLVLAKTAASALYGWLAFALALGLALLVLNLTLPRTVWPPFGLWSGLAILAAGLAWVTAALGARVSMTAFTAQAARQLLRMAFLFLLLVGVALPRFLPPSMQAALQRALTRQIFPVACLAIAAVLLLLGVWLFRSAISMLEERRQGLSILPPE